MEKKLRMASLGDVGTVLGASATPGSGLATLQIETDEAIVLVHGDHRMIGTIIDDLEGEIVEVVDGEGDSFNIRPLY